MFEPHASRATFLLFTFEDRGPMKAAKEDAQAGSTMRFSLSLIIFIALRNGDSVAYYLDKRSGSLETKLWSCHSRTVLLPIQTNSFRLSKYFSRLDRFAWRLHGSDLIGLSNKRSQHSSSQITCLTIRVRIYLLESKIENQNNSHLLVAICSEWTAFFVVIVDFLQIMAAPSSLP